ncbi:FecR domain-containing protein [Mucilaginibacter pocheonensis]|uniref:Ferric-dicitrate binding protein FerR (Iron transport regulator) n=1 Tax=Mucilaginibacter pocheonensis TaxID=398050 RepID=A0ABU1T9Q6_9SPHI|nr:FecR domain-containing protein [Mucilaginibacter pocheonensis]MDR6941945.1 ferric-dicitrate binding protein FerR (iron transport regulator) [Mucilaginibacter pocheonensis]
MSNANTNMNDDMLVKYLAGEVTPAEFLQVEEWIAASETNRKLYDEFKLIWDQSPVTARNVSKDDAFIRLQNRIKNTAPAPPKALIKKLKPTYWVGLAASVVLICTVLWLTFNHVYDNPASAFVRIDSRNKVHTQTLPDGSVITLNTRSTIVYPNQFTGNLRPVSLRGEAFFKVTPNKTKPFIIKVNDVTVRVVGTSFNIKSRNGKTEVIVETGVVKVSKKQNSIDLNPGEKVTVNSDQSQLSKEASKGKLYNYYLTGQLVCDKTPLHEVVQTLNEVYGAHIIIANKSLQNLPITTTFQGQSLDEILGIIADTFKITVVRQNQQIIFK